MICSLSHDARMPRQQDVVAGVNNFGSVRCKNLVSDLAPVNAHAAPLVKAVQHVIDIAKVGYSVVCAVMVDMVNDIRLFAVNKKPSKAVSGEVCAVDPDLDVAEALLQRAGNSSDLGFVVVVNPGEHARFRVVGENIANRVWYKFCSHAESLLSVVRGLTVGAVSAPILTRESNNGR